MKNIYLQIPDKLPLYAPLALSTIIWTSGSTPQKPGSSALFGSSGLLSGTIGGGILEAKIHDIARKAVLMKESGLYHFKFDNEITQVDEAICGGQADVLVDANLSDHLAVFEQVKESLLQGIPGVLLTRITGINGRHVSIQRAWVSGSERPGSPSPILPDWTIDVRTVLAENIPDEYTEFTRGVEKEVRIFMEPLSPLPQLIIAGAGHIGRALAHLGNLLEFDVTVIDNREDYANFENIPDADHMVANDIGAALNSVKINSDTYIVIVTPGHKNDSDALKSCIRSDAAYIGMIGSKKKIALMRNNFMEKGWATPSQWESVHAPIGLDINSKTVQEIAVSIAAQLVEVKNNKVKVHG